MDESIKQWNDLFDNGILGLDYKECSDILCFFHGRIKGRLSAGWPVTEKHVVEAMREAVDYVKAKQTQP